jgi:excisionase family DNA binding protein
VSRLRLSETRPADDTPWGVFKCWRLKLLSNKVLLSLKEVSALAGLSLRTTTKLIASGEIKSIRVGRRRLVPRDELDRFARGDHSTGLQEKSVHEKMVGR